jgi:hypothetical protein
MDERNAQKWREVAAVAARQHGMVSVGDLHGLGVGKGSIEKAVSSGRLIRVHVGVFAVGYVPRTRESRWMAAVLACGEGALLSHRCAASHWRIREGVGPRVDVTVDTRNGRSRRGILVHRVPLAPPDVATHLGIPTTSPSRTLVDVSFEVGVDELQRALREMQFQRLFDLAAVQEVLARRPSRKLQPLIDDVVCLQTGIEDEFFDLCDRYGLPRPLTQRRVEGVKVDFWWPEHRLVVETDGWWAHSTFDAFQRDRSNTNRLQLSGHTVLRFTFADIQRRGATTARQVRRALGRFDHPLDERNART